VNKIRLALIICLLSWTGCKIAAPTFDGLRNARMVTGSKGELGVEAELKITNPNKFGFSLKKINAEVWLSNAHLGRVWLYKKIKIKRQSSDFHRIRLLTDGTTAGTILNQITSIFSGSPTLQIKGNAVAQVCIFRKKFAFDQAEKLPRSSFQIPGF